MNTVARDRLIQSVCTQVPANVSAPMTKMCIRDRAIPVPQEEGWGLILLLGGIAAFFLVGLISLKLARMWMISVTAITGAANAVNALRPSVDALAENDALFLAAAGVLAILGILVQRAMMKRADAKKAAKAERKAADGKESKEHAAAPAPEPASPAPLSLIHI